MGFDSYLKTINEKTGMTVDDFKAQAAAKNLTTYKEVLAWLKTDYGLGHGHANLVAQLVTKSDEVYAPQADKMADLFKGAKAHWRPSYDALAAKLLTFGPDVKLGANRSYINATRNSKKFAILDPATKDRFDVGIKLKGVEPNGRYEAAGAWNEMVTHRVQISDPGQIDDDLLAWLHRAYDAA